MRILLDECVPWPMHKLLLTHDCVTAQKRGCRPQLTPIECWLESEKLWQTYRPLGGSLDPNPIRKVLSF
jgi:hypothetical protein